MRELEARFKNAGQTIKRYRPDEEIGDFPPSAGAIETMHWGELGVHEVLCQLPVKVVEQRADELVAEAVRRPAAEYGSSVAVRFLSPTPWEPALPGEFNPWR